MILTAAAIAFAFIHSAMPADVSSEESAGVLDFLYNFLRAVGISAELTDHIVRKRDRNAPDHLRVFLRPL